MSPPDKPGIPERFRRSAVEDLVTATGPHTPVPTVAPRERQRSRPEVDPEVLSDADVAKTFHGQRVSVPVILLTTLITAGASVLGTYFATRAPVAAPAPTAGCLTKDAFDESMRTRDEQTARRFDALETDMSYVKVTVRLVQDRLPPQK